MASTFARKFCGRLCFEEAVVVKKLHIVTSQRGGDSRPDEQMRHFGHGKAPLLGHRLYQCVKFGVDDDVFGPSARNYEILLNSHHSPVGKKIPL
jgi:hypothetical protein